MLNHLSILIPSLTLLITIPILFFYLSPSSLPFPQHQLSITVSDELDDTSLFQKAIAADSTFHQQTHRHHKKPRFRLGSANIRRQKLAFLFLTHTHLHFKPLWQKFFNKTDPHLFNIYIHQDPSSPRSSRAFTRSPLADPSTPRADPIGSRADSYTSRADVFENRFIHPRRTQRASPTLISATRRLLAHALLDDPDNAYFALISQNCVPLHSFSYLYSFLLDTKRLSRKMQFPSYIEILDESPSLLDRYNARGENVMEPEVKFSEFRVGSQFFVLTRRHSLMVIKDTKLWSKFKKPCLKIESCYPEEHYFPTLLSMEDPNGCTGFTLTRVNWTGMVDGHPHSYGANEVSPELIRELRGSNGTYEYMFARKFEPECLGPLMEMADSVIFKD